MISLCVPATTGNVGPGFDSLGLAFSLYAHFGFEKLPAGKLEFEGCAEEYCNEENLAVQAFRATERALGVEPSGIGLKIATDVPVSRGLGSSATLLAAGAYAANALNGGNLAPVDLLNITTRIEGHPDNLAPALLGGLCASVVLESEVVCVRYPVHERLRFVALIPDFPLSTSLARRALPDAYSRKDAVFNLSRTGVLIRALESGDRGLIRVALDDRLHQPFRAKLIRGFDTVQTAALDLGAEAMIISGSGPTLLAVTDQARAEAFAREIERRLRPLGDGWLAIEMSVDKTGTHIES